jgi:hypothetical protein
VIGAGRRVETLLEQWNEGPYIFNLGHGILPDTPIAHVEQVLARVTGKSELQTQDGLRRPRRLAWCCSTSAGRWPCAVRPFLFNLFNDPAIIGLPAVVRYPAGGLIAKRPGPKPAQANYAIMGGGSPLLPETEAQAAALEGAPWPATAGV